MVGQVEVRQQGEGHALAPDIVGDHQEADAYTLGQDEAATDTYPRNAEVKLNPKSAEFGIGDVPYQYHRRTREGYMVLTSVAMDGLIRPRTGISVDISRL